MNKYDTEKIYPWKEFFNSQKVEFERSYPLAFEILKVGGVHPDKVVEMENPYTGEQDNEDFRNIGEHCVSVAIVAEKITNKLKEIGVINDNECKKIVERALIHDANKRFEVMRKKNRGARHSEGVYDEEAYKTMQNLLKKQGISKDLLDYIEKAGKETGHNSLVDFISLDKDNKVVLNSERSLEEMVVHLADDMTASPLPGSNGDTKFVTTGERMSSGNFKERYPFLYKEGLGFNQNGEVVSVKDIEDAEQNFTNVKTYAEYQEIVAKLISSYLKKIIDSENQDDSEQFIKKIINS